MSFRPPTLKDAAAIVRPHNEQLMRDLRLSLLLERIARVCRDLENGMPPHVAADVLRYALKDFGSEAQHGKARHGAAGYGAAGRGLARQGGAAHSKARHDKA